MEEAPRFFTRWESPVGELTLCSDGTALTGLWFRGQKFFAQGKPLGQPAELPVFRDAEEWLQKYFRGERPDPGLLPLAPEGTAMQKIVWDLLLRIPYGHTETYGSLARKTAEAMGKSSMSAQAVGGAVGRNPISILIPCHRVVGANGSLTGYAGGLEKKAFLLELEGADIGLPDR